MSGTSRAIAVTAAIAAMVCSLAAEAAFFGVPKALKQQVSRLSVEGPAPAPMAHARFCLQYPDQCRVPRLMFRGGRTTLTPERWAELVRINTEVNRAIRPEPNLRGVAHERWLIGPSTGDCNDYAVTKRAELIKRGWPARNLLLAEVVVPSGEHHLVLVLRTTEGDLVADNLAAGIRPLATPRYRWLRAQSPRNPLFWSSIVGLSA
jgi:predicted transglutaminase-like cysteine proteinase